MVVRAGGAIHTTGVQLRQEPEERLVARIDGRAVTLRQAFHLARTHRTTPAVTQLTEIGSARDRQPPTS
ncbi:hypothetical protein ACFV06_37875 [Streptomyces sp. NPDC059618]|uniref:hypothetical protein n=1 Tax=Streptomyces sp. NPDC059618 TaxID=3346887 RepID=UPI00369AD0AC